MPTWKPCLFLLLLLLLLHLAIRHSVFFCSRPPPFSQELRRSEIQTQNGVVRPPETNFLWFLLLCVSLFLSQWQSFTNICSDRFLNRRGSTHHTHSSPLSVSSLWQNCKFCTREGKEARSGQEGKGIVYFGAFNQSGSRGVAFVHLPNVEERKEGRYSEEEEESRPWHNLPKWILISNVWNQPCTWGMD